MGSIKAMEIVSLNESISAYENLMMFTGIKDKNDKEIYEGDIVEHRHLSGAVDLAMYGLQSILGERRQVVEFKNSGFQPFSNYIDDAIKDLRYEVIGNIYENPELLNNK